MQQKIYTAHILDRDDKLIHLHVYMTINPLVLSVVRATIKPEYKFQ